MTDLRKRLKIPGSKLAGLNAVLLDENNRLVKDLLEVVAKYGTPKTINRKAQAARELPALMKRVKAVKPEFLSDLEWLLVG